VKETSLRGAAFLPQVKIMAEELGDFLVEKFCADVNELVEKG
jgi:hypothetical protein